MSSLKVAVYSGEIPSTTFIENLSHALGQAGISVLVFGKRIKPIPVPGENVSIIPTPRYGWKTFFYVLINGAKLLLTNPGHFSKLRSHISTLPSKGWLRWWWWSKYLPVINNKPDIFHIQWARNTDEWMFLKRIFGIRVVVSLRGTQINSSPLVDPHLAESYIRNFPEVDGFHAVCGQIARQAEKYGAAQQKTKVIYSGIRKELLDTLTKEQHGRQDRINIISAGRMHWVKGYHIALQALRNLYGSNFRFHYTIVAGGDNEEVLYLIDEFGLGEQVTLTAPCSQKELFEMMLASDLLLLPSVEEGIANVVLEAMAIGVPVLSSDCGGMNEVVKHQTTGLLFRNRDVQHLEAMLLHFASLSQAEKSEITANARTMVADRFSIDRSASEMKEFYLSLNLNTISL